MEDKRVTLTPVGAGGRIVLPSHMRRQLGLAVGDQVEVRVEGTEIRVSRPGSGWDRAREIARRYLDPNRNYLEEFIAERRAEAAREARELDR